MSVLLTRGTRLSQPQGPVEVDWANPLASGAIRFYKMSDLTGLDSVTKLFGSYANNPSILAGPSGLSVDFNGSNNRLVVDAIRSTVGATQLMLSATIKPDTNTVAQNIIRQGYIGSFQFFLRIESTGKVSFSLNLNSGAVTLLSATGISTSKYTNIICVFDGASSKIYLDGVLDASTTAAGYIATPTSYPPASIGARITNDSTASSFDQYFNGAIRDVSLFLSSPDDASVKSISANPWQLFKPVQRRVWFDGGAAAGGTSQTIAFTLEDLTSSVSQTLSHSQSAAFTLDGISSTVNQAVTHSQSLGATLDDVTASISQELAGAKSQSIAFTLDGITASVSQTASHAQSLAITLDDVTVAISQSAAPSSKDQSLAITLDDIFVDIKQAGPRRRQAGGKRNYIIKGKKYHLNDYELAVMIQGMLEEVERSDVEIDDGEAVKKVSRRVWKQLKESNAQLDFTLKELQSKVAIQDIDDEDDIALLML